MRYQYRQLLPGDSAVFQVGVSGNQVQRLIIADKDVAGALVNTGFKVYKAPAQPTKTYTVAVDSLIDRARSPASQWHPRGSPPAAR